MEAKGVKWRIHDVITMNSTSFWLETAKALHGDGVARLLENEDPFLVDALFEYWYTGDYNVPENGIIQHAFENPHDPDPPKARMSKSEASAEFHSNMLILAREKLHDKGLVDFVLNKIATLLKGEKGPKVHYYLTQKAYAPSANGPAGGLLRRSAIAAVVRFESDWEDAADGFLKRTYEKAPTEFRHAVRKGKRWWRRPKFLGKNDREYATELDRLVWFFLARS